MEATIKETGEQYKAAMYLTDIQETERERQQNQIDCLKLEVHTLRTLYEKAKGRLSEDEFMQGFTPVEWGK